ncbi:8392_t:CDS:1 [Funneliformis geosporum]|nr:8392_t:CDS:1 [Funneliformis geosporum]
MSKLPSNSNLLRELLISSDISKPPNMWANDFYLSADCSNYSRVYPGIGRSYARNVRIDRPPLFNVPDPESLFDTLMVRKEFKLHPSSISSMLLSHTNEPYINQISSYLDLAPLYGRNLKEQMSVRQGRLGLLNLTLLLTGDSLYILPMFAVY